MKIDCRLERFLT